MNPLSKTVKTLLCSVAVCACFIGVSSAIDVSAGTVTAKSNLNMRASASSSASVISSIPSGAQVYVYSSTADGWLNITYGGRIGYASAAYISVLENAEGNFGIGTVTGSSVNVRADATTGSAVLTSVSKGTSVTLTGVKNDWYKVNVSGVVGYIHSDYLTTVSGKAAASNGSSASSDVIAYAKTFLGTPYVYGGSSPKGFDCSGFTSYVYKQFGVSLNRSSSAQLSNCTKISKSDLQPGDLVFFSRSSSSSTIGHVGIYIGNGNFIHSSSPGDVVKIDSMSSSYYSSHYVASGRINA